MLRHVVHPGDTALRFGHWFGVAPQFWLNLQTQFDLAAAERRAGADVRKLPTAAQMHSAGDGAARYEHAGHEARRRP